MADNSGNIGKSSGDSETGTNISTPSANTAPRFTTQAYCSSRSTNSLTISAVATDNEQTSLTYTLYGGTSSSDLSYITSKTGTRGNIVNIIYSGRSSYVYYYFRIDVSDGITTTKGIVSSARSSCSGTTNSCLRWNSSFVFFLFRVRDEMQSLWNIIGMGMAVSFTFGTNEIL